MVTRIAMTVVETLCDNPSIRIIAVAYGSQKTRDMTDQFYIFLLFRLQSYNSCRRNLTFSINSKKTLSRCACQLWLPSKTRIVSNL